MGALHIFARNTKLALELKMETILGAKQPVLHPFNKLPELNSAVVLVSISDISFS